MQSKKRAQLRLVAECGKRTQSLLRGWGTCRGAMDLGRRSWRAAPPGVGSAVLSRTLGLAEGSQSPISQRRGIRSGSKFQVVLDSRSIPRHGGKGT